MIKIDISNIKCGDIISLQQIINGETAIERVDDRVYLTIE